MPINNASYINLLPIKPVEPRNIATTYQRARTMRNQNAAAEANLEQIPEERENARNVYALNRMKTEQSQQQQLLRNMAPDVVAWNSRWENTLKESGGDRKAALEKIQPQWEAYVPTAKEKGYPVTDTFDPDETRAVLDILRTQKIVSGGESSESPTDFIDQKTGKPYTFNKNRGTFKLGVVEDGGIPVKRSSTAKPTQKDKDVAAYAKRYNVDEDTVREVMNTQRFKATGNFEKALDRFQRKQAAGETEQAPPKTKWYQELLGGGKKEERPVSQPNIPHDPKANRGRVIRETDTQGNPTGRRFKSDGKNWILQSSRTGQDNLAMNAEDVPIGSGMADQAKTEMQLRKELNEAYLARRLQAGKRT